MQYAWDFARVALTDPLHQKSWTDAVKNILLDNRIDYLLRHFQLLKICLQGEALVMLERLMRYYQRRLKRSGQRWSKSGAQQIAQLRVAKKSNRWQKVIQMAQNGKMVALASKVSCTLHDLFLDSDWIISFCTFHRSFK